MTLAGNLIVAVAELLSFAISLLELLIIFQVIVSWTGISLPLNRFTRLLYVILEGLYGPIRSVVPTVFGGLDITPLLALAALYLIDHVLISELLRIGYRLSVG